MHLKEARTKNKLREFIAERDEFPKQSKESDYE